MKTEKILIPQRVLLRLYDFNFEEGTTTYKENWEIYDHNYSWLTCCRWNTRIGQSILGAPFNNGYASTHLWGKRHTYHRLLYYAYTGKQPNMIDHKDKNRLNNRINNLREANNHINQNNQKISTQGISKKSSGYWGVRVCYNKERLYLGTYPTEQSAIKARNKFIEEHPELLNIEYLV